MAKKISRKPKASPPTPSPSLQLSSFIAKFTPEMQWLAKAILRKMRGRLPGATEMVYDNYNALVVGFCPNERASDVVFSIAVYPRWINLFFFEGDTLPDPDGLLQGTGSIVRRIVLQRVTDLDKPGVKRLMEVALERADPPLDPKARRRLLIRAVSVKQRPRRPTHTQGGDFSPRRAHPRRKPSLAVQNDG